MSFFSQGRASQGKSVNSGISLIQSESHTHRKCVFIWSGLLCLLCLKLHRRMLKCSCMHLLVSGLVLKY